ncbi:MAG: PEP-CTERM sorting domain-containing protein [Planctomycetota bacterium]|nr:PEP-CTERM sorting domain-containing protein [Planctomycetota bacterium]
MRRVILNSISFPPATQLSSTPGAGWASWTATASTGLLNATPTGLYAAQAGASLTMDFTAQYDMPMGGVRGIGGGFQLVNAQGQAVAGKIWLRLSSGASIFRTISSANSFMGFWVADPTQVITSFKVQPMGTGAAFFVGAETMYLGTAVVPAPGALALLAAAGITGGVRRRR